MTSLRSRVIVGAAVIALVPLAAAMLLLTWRLESSVRAEAAARLDAALGSLRRDVEADAARMTSQLAILARDPELRRLYLVGPATHGALAEYLAERRTLLALDALSVADSAGRPVAGGMLRPDAAIDPGVAIEVRAPILYLGAPAGTLTGARVLDPAFLARLKQTSGLDLVLLDGRGRPVAATLPAAPDAAVAGAGDAVRRIAIGGRGYLARGLALPAGSGAAPHIVGLVATAAADRTIAAIQWASLALGALGLALAVALGALWSAQVARPVERLAAFSERVAHGEWDEPLRIESVQELETLVAALERMRSDLRAYRDRLVISERQAAWSQMARKVAHEVKNPLTPIAISIADLKRSYDQRRPDFPEILAQAVRTIGEEIESLRVMLQEFSDFARMPPPAFGPCGVPELFADLATLYRREIAERRLSVVPPSAALTLSADRGQLRQALVNLIKNGLEAVDAGGHVDVSAAAADGQVTIAVRDDGPGLAAGQRDRLFTPGFTTKEGGSGLGLTIVQRIVHDHGGTVSVAAGAGRGTTFTIRLPHTRET